MEPSVLLVNVQARHGQDAFELSWKYLAALGVPLLDAKEVREPSRLPQLVRAALRAGAGRILVGGGDGTLSTAAAELVGQPVRLGLLPIGTCNDFARSVGIPLPLEDACRVAAGNHTRKVDLGRADGRTFLNAASVGISSAMTRRLSRDLKRRLGKGAMAVAAAGELLSHRAFRMRLVTPELSREVEAHQVVVANGRYHGGGRLVSPQARHDDRLLEVYAILSAQQREGAEADASERLRDLWTLLRVASLLRRGRHLEHPQVLHLRSARVHLEADPPQQLDLDGELAGHTPTDFEVLPGALEVLVPR